MKAWVLSLTFILLIASTASADQDSLSGFDLIHQTENYYKPLFLDNIANQEKRIEEFIQNHTRYSEVEKIHYLLSSTKNSSCVFVRNGLQYNGDAAVRFLRWKMLHRQRNRKPVKTARDFVRKVAMRSNKTGIPYEIILPDGRRKKAKDVFLSELEFLERAILTHQHVNRISAKSIPLSKV